MPSYLKPGDVLRDRYHVVGLIGAGGMGAVYLVDDDRIEGRQCAIKETVPQPNVSEAVALAHHKQFQQEASTLARLDHPGLPKVSDFFSTDGHDYLAMDFVPGQNLEEIVNEARRENRFLDQPSVLGWVDQLCDALTYLHSRQPSVLHRDIKPANIKLTPEGRVKLVDFGLVKPLDPNDPSTLTGLQGAGSLPYAPLEQYVEHLGHTDARSDLYALGATVYHLLTGKVPASAQERFLIPELLPPPCEVNPDISPGVSDAILTAMAPHPRDRPASIALWQQLLHSSASTAPLQAGHPSGADWPASLRENWWLAGIALVLLIASVLVTFN